QARDDLIDGLFLSLPEVRAVLADDHRHPVAANRVTIRAAVRICRMWSCAALTHRAVTVRCWRNVAERLRIVRAFFRVATHFGHFLPKISFRPLGLGASGLPNRRRFQPGPFRATRPSGPTSVPSDPTERPHVPSDPTVPSTPLTSLAPSPSFPFLLREK